MPRDPAVAPTLSGKPGSPNEGITAIEYTWSPCAGGDRSGVLEIYRLRPRMARRRAALSEMLGRGTDLIDANQVMWHFFGKFSLPEKSP